jgi:hypothetical protein
MIYHHDWTSNMPDEPQFCFRCHLQASQQRKYPTCNDYLDATFGKGKWRMKGYAVKIRRAK